MTQALAPEEIERLARRRAGAKLSWYAHAAVFVLGTGTGLRKRMVQKERQRLQRQPSTS